MKSRIWLFFSSFNPLISTRDIMKLKSGGIMLKKILRGIGTLIIVILLFLSLILAVFLGPDIMVTLYTEAIRI